LIRLNTTSRSGWGETSFPIVALLLMGFSADVGENGMAWGVLRVEIECHAMLRTTI